MSEYTSADLMLMFEAVAAAMEAEKGRLCELDGAIGDADHGLTMALGFSAVVAALAKLTPQDEPTTVFNTAAKAFLNAVGASAGPLYATALLRAGASVKGMAALTPDAVVGVVAAMAKGVQERGKAERGEKTMVDAWAPAAEAAQAARAAGKPLGACLAEAVAAAEAGAEATRSMLAAKGRASRLGERARGHIDPGAASAVIVLKSIAGALGR